MKKCIANPEQMQEVNCRLGCNGCALYREDKRKNKITADEIFENLGYKKQGEDNWQIFKYIKDDYNIIYFHGNKTCCKTGAPDCNWSDDVTMKELEAICKKCKELGWLK